jgi:nitrogen fixation/metabolism regulation signal transduction histidine kinase
MDYKGVKFNISIRLAGLLLTMFALVALIYDQAFVLTILFIVIILGVQVISLYKYMDKSREGLLSFLQAIKSRDFSQSYPTDTPSNEQNKINHEFNEIMDQFNAIKKEREADFQYLKNIVQHVGIGLITFGNNGDVQIANTASKNLLKFKHIENIRELSSLSEELVDIFFRLKTGGRDLIKLNIQGDIVQLAVYAIELTLRSEEFKLISVQNIQSELEEKEMEAWQNLVRVLTHEIMNSVTPISSLANTMEEELKVQLDNGKDEKTITMEDAEDLHLAISTIQKRSAGLIRFVQDFRNLTHIPKPKFDTVKIRPMIDQISILMKSEIESQGVNLNILINPEDMTVNADKELIEQVLINLIKNATQAFDEQTNKLVEVNAHFSEKGRPVISIKDNGNGIDEEALQKIFIPFFTTKKSGSGIGLSLSRQIMRQHQGVLAVKSTVDEGTEFELRF